MMMMWAYPCCLWLLMMTSASVESARILAVLPIGAKSHHVFFQPILHTLAARGHHVTVYSPFPPPQSSSNYTHIALDSPLSDVDKSDSVFWDFVKSSQVAWDRSLWGVTSDVSEHALRQPAVQRLLHSSDHYDLVLTQALVGQEALLAFGHKFNAPTIALQPKVACTIDNYVAGNTLSTAFIPDVGLPFSPSMNLIQRAINAYSKLSLLWHYHHHQLPLQQAVVRRHFPLSTPPLADLVFNISLMFTMGHPSALYSQPSTPNLVPVGGIHITHQTNPLPTDIKAFMDDAENGVIYFSLGTYVPDDKMDEEYFQNYIKVFRNLPQRVLWKTRSEHLEGLSANVMIRKWMPQQSILAHPRTVLFITHGGMLSQHEALHFGIPVVCIPYFADQPMNARFYEYTGIGLILDFQKLSEDSIRQAVTTVLNQSRFQANAKKISKIYRARTVTTTESVVFWTEHLLEHGSTHLQPASRPLSIYQRALLDVVALTLSLISITCYASYLISLRLYCYFMNWLILLPRLRLKIKTT